jgi:hypothetical protein
VYEPDGLVISVRDHYRITVTGPPADPDGNDRFVLQTDETGRVVGVTPLLPGQSISGEQVWEFDTIATVGCVFRVNCYAIVKDVAFVEFRHGTFPNDLWPGDGPPPITPPGDPNDDPYGFGNETKQREAEQRLNCLVGVAGFVTSTAPTPGFSEGIPFDPNKEHLTKDARNSTEEAVAANCPHGD